MNKTNVMLDLETWSTSPNAVITSIGAVKFAINPNNSGGNIIDEFYYRINPQSCVDIGMEMSVDTILWWMKKSEEARSEFQKPTRTIQDVLWLFTTWLNDDPKNIDVWGNGTDFDNVILENAYKACYKILPWNHFNNRCFRTLKSLFPNVPTLGEEPAGVKHNALDDAKSQAFRAIDILCHINKLTVPTVVSEVPKTKNIKKETVRIALPPKSILDKVLKADKTVKPSLMGKYSGIDGQYDDAAFEKAYNTPCSMRSVDDTVKGMKNVREFDFVEGNDEGKKVVDKPKK